MTWARGSVCIQIHRKEPKLRPIPGLLPRDGGCSMDAFRRDFLKLATTGLAGAATTVIATPGARADTPASMPAAGTASVYDVRLYGAKGDGKTIDSPAINRAIEAAAAAGGGTIWFRAGVYA